MSVAEIDKLSGKKVLAESGLAKFTHIMRCWGMNIKVDDYRPEMTLLQKFTKSRADIASYSVTNVDEGQAILQLPREVGRKFVVFINIVSLGIPEIAQVHQKIEGAEIPWVWTNTPGWKNEVFAATLLRALGQERTK